MTTRAKWILGIAAGLTATGIVLLVRGRRRKAKQVEVEAQAQAMVKADVGLVAPEKANNVVKYGVALLNAGGVTEFQFEAMYQQMQAQRTLITTDARDKIVAYFAQKQPEEHKLWKKHNHGQGVAAKDREAYKKLVATALRDMMKLRPKA